MAKSPYFKKHRLADVVAAIQVMGTHRECKLGIEEWAVRLPPANQGDNTAYWKNVLLEHREFFFVEDGRASLLLRKSFPKLYHIKDRKEYSHELFDASTDEQRTFFTNRPLSSGEVSELVGAALAVHESTINMAKEIRWLIIPLIGILGVVIGGALKSVL